jgi:DnaJ domain
MQTHFELLGLDADASRRDINAAYRKLAKKFHPDKGGDAVVFQQITQAYQALTRAGEQDVAVARPKPAPAREAQPAPARPAIIERVLQKTGYVSLSAGAFLIGLFLLDGGDGIHEEFNPVLLSLGSVFVLMSVGLFVNRRRVYDGFSDALLWAAQSILVFLFDILARVYLVLVLAFGVVALLGLVNLLKQHFLHFLPGHF